MKHTGLKRTSKAKWAAFICVFVLAAISVLGLGLNLPKTAAAEHTTPNAQQLYEGYQDAPSEDFYNNNIRISGAPMITVLTHGLAQSARTWSNNYSNIKAGEDFGFAYDSTSLIEQLRVSSGGANVFWAKMESDSDFYLINLEVQEQFSRYKFIPYNPEKPTELFTETTSLLKLEHLYNHIVLVFESTSAAAGGTHASVYAQFENMLNRIVRDVARLTDGIYPKINLIGHSRGGLTNMEYAQNYPRFVDTLISLGTPYSGSNFGRINLFANMLGVQQLEGFHDIQSITEQDRLRNNWNELYANQYSPVRNIKFYPMAGTSTLDFLDMIVQEYEDWGKYHIGAKSQLQELLFGFSFYGTVFWAIIDTGTPLIGARLQIIYGIRDAESNAGIPNTSSAIIDNALSALNREGDIVGIGGRVIVNDDLMVGISSQRAEGYAGIHAHTPIKRYDTGDKHTLKKVSDSDLPIVHNLQARDPDFIRYILTRLNLGATDVFETNILPDNTLEITSMRSNPFLGAIVIPTEINGITVSRIGNSAFLWRREITDVVIPNTIISIGNRAFEGINLQSVIIPNSVIEIGQRAFYNNIWLEEVIFEPESRLETIGNQAFAVRTSLRNITIPDSVIHIGDSAFADNQNLEEVTFGKATKLQTIGINVFAGCHEEFSLTWYYNPTKQISNINQFVTTMIIPNTITQILANAFSGSTKLTTVLFEENSTLHIIADYAFQDSLTLQNIIIPASVTSIGNNVFTGSINLTSISVESGNTVYRSEGNCIIRNSDNTLIIGIKTSVIPTSVTGIGMGAFYRCTGFTSITIPSSVSFIENNAFAYTSLSNITFAEGSQLYTIGESAFQATQISGIIIPSNVVNIDDWAFYNSSKLTSVTIPDSVRRIGRRAFADTGLYNSTSRGNAVYADRWVVGFYGDTTNFVLRPNIVGIADGAFWGIAFSTVVIPNSVRYIGSGAFDSCTSITSIIIPASVWIIGSDLFRNNHNLTIYAEAATKPNGWAVDWNPNDRPVFWGFSNAYYDLEGTSATLRSYAGADAYFDIPETVLINGVERAVTKIANSAFAGNTSLTSIRVPATVTQIGQGAFANNANLVSVIIERPSVLGVTTLGLNAFAGCSALQAIYVSNEESVTAYRAAANWSGHSAIIKVMDFFVDVINNNELKAVWDNTFAGFSGMTLTITASSWGWTNYGTTWAEIQRMHEVFFNSTVSEYNLLDVPFLAHGYTPNGIGNIGIKYIAQFTNQTLVFERKTDTKFAGDRLIDNELYGVISCERHLRNIGIESRGSFVGGNYILANDIFIAREWSPVEIGFMGLFNGDNYSIVAENNFVVQADNLFAYGSGTVINLGNGSNPIDPTDPDPDDDPDNFGFSGSSITGYFGTSSAIAIPDTATSIAAGAFADNTSLTSVSIPHSVTSIGLGAFSGTESLETLEIPFSGQNRNGGNNTHFGYIFGAQNMNGQASFIPQSLKTVRIDGLNGTQIANNAFNGMGGVETVIIADGVTAIGSDAFRNNSALTFVEIASTVSNIANAFGNSPNAAVKWHFNASAAVNNFRMNLTEVVIPDTVTALPNNAFRDSVNLVSVTIPNSVTSIGNSAFQGCVSLTEIALPASITEIGAHAFNGCTSLTSIIIPHGVTTIRDNTFNGCSALTSIVIPASVTQIQSDAFRNCNALTTVYYGGESAAQFNAINTGNNTQVVNANRYYYSETEPATQGNYWHFDHGVPTAW